MFEWRKTIKEGSKQRICLSHYLSFSSNTSCFIMKLQSKRRGGENSTYKGEKTVYFFYKSAGGTPFKDISFSCSVRFRWFLVSEHTTNPLKVLSAQKLPKNPICNARFYLGEVTLEDA